MLSTRITLAAAFFAVCLPHTSPAEPAGTAATASAAAAAEVTKVAELFDTLGIFGTWAVSCEQVASPRTPRFRYTAQPDGSVAQTIDSGTDGTSKTTVIAAIVLPGDRLQTTSFTTFDNLPRPIRAAMEHDGIRSDLTVRSTFSTVTRGVLLPLDRFLLPSQEKVEIQVVGDGFALNPATRQPGNKMPPISKCPE